MAARAGGRPRAGLVIFLLLSLAGLGTLLPENRGRAADHAVSFGPSGLDGAGFQNVVAIDPRGTGLVLSGGDVAGVHRSTDWGRTWRTSNLGLASLQQRKVAALTFSPTAPDTVYAAVGDQGTGGGVLRSTDGGLSWAIRSTVPQFAGDNTNKFPGLPNPHPRSTGNLLALDHVSGGLYAATFQQGVMRSADGGATWTALGLSGQYLRSLALDPANPDLLYASTYGDGVYRTTSASTTGAFVRLTNAPTTVEELAVLDGRVYAVAGPAGLYGSSDAGQTWARLGAVSVRSDGPLWMAIDAYRDPVTGAHVLTVGCDNPKPAGTGNYDSVLRSGDGGTTWTSLTADPGRVRYTAGGAGGETWWLSRVERPAMLGGSGYTAATIVTAPNDRQRIFVAGRAGVWASSDAAATWYPMVHEMGVTINKAVVADPNVPGRVLVANTDRTLLTSADGMATVAQARPAGTNTGFALALDPTGDPSTVYLGTGHRTTNTQGEIYSSVNPTAGWTKQGLAAAAGGKRPIGLAVRRVNGSPVILAAVSGGGIWRKAGGSWKKVNSVAMGTQRTEGAPFSWLPGSSTVYLYDRQTGVWRSTDNGVKWALIWSKSSLEEMTGYLAADPTDPSRLYVSAKDGVFRLDGATAGTVGSGISAVQIGAFRGGPVAVDNGGRVHVARPMTTASPAALLVSHDRGTTWVTLSDRFYQSAALFPYGLALGPGGELYVALNGNGVVVGGHDTTPPTVTVDVPEAAAVFDGLPVVVTGRADDDKAVASVQVAVEDTATGQWLQPDGAWGAPAQRQAVLAEPESALTAWTHAISGLGSGLYRLEAHAFDATGNLSALVTVAFEVRLPDTSPPSVSIVTPVDDEVFDGLPVFAAGAAQDDRGVAAVRVAVQDRISGLWLQTDGTWGAHVAHDATVAGPGATSSAWSHTVSDLVTGVYLLEAEAFDAAGNTSDRVPVPFEITLPEAPPP